MNFKATFLVSILIWAAACTSKVPPQLPPRPPLFINEVSGSSVRTADMPLLRYGENIKAYSVGRHIDPADPSVMHEGSIVYRIERDSAWNLQPGLPPKIPFAGEAAKSVGDNEDALRAEIEVKANEQRLLYRYIKEASEEAAGQMDALQSSAQISRKLLEQNKLLKGRLSESELKNKKLQADLSKVKDQLQVLLKFYKKTQEEKIQSKFRRER